jgi:glycosyltransferase involved in cell wall biosynthesis
VPERNLAVERSLTVLLPVQDAQATLTETVEEVLDVAAELTDRFELLIIDDGSADATSEIAHELTRHYPQVRAIRHSKPLGRDAALRTGLAQSRGEVVFVRDKGRGTIEKLLLHSRPGRPNFISRPKRSAADR